MTVSMVFNDLCLRKPASDRATARLWMSDFVQLLKAAWQQNLREFRSHAEFKDLLLSPDYPMNAWFGDREVDIEMQRTVRRIRDRGELIVPYDNDLSKDNAIVIRRELFEAIYEEESALGLGYAYLFDGIAISLRSESCWDVPSLNINCRELLLDRGELLENLLSIRHASHHSHLEFDHSVWIQNQLRRSVRDGEELQNKCGQWFPNLVFCDTARNQLRKLQKGSLQLPRIIDRLFELEQFCLDWSTPGFDGSKFKNASYETTTTMQQYGRQREFICPDGQIRVFEFHLKNIPNAWRIHIWPDLQTRRILVGYIGPHLSTVSDPT